MFDPEFATPRKIGEFTGCKTLEAQVLVLKSLRVPHVVGPRQNPITRLDELSKERPRNPTDVIPSCGEIAAMKAMPRIGVGIYFLYQDSKVVYVGKTTNFFTRMRNHALGDLEFNCVRFLPASERRLDTLEREYIARFRPKYNKVHNKAYQPDTAPLQAATLPTERKE